VRTAKFRPFVRVGQDFRGIELRSPRSKVHDCDHNVGRTRIIKAVRKFTENHHHRGHHYQPHGRNFQAFYISMIVASCIFCFFVLCLFCKLVCTFTENIANFKYWRNTVANQTYFQVELTECLLSRNLGVWISPIRIYRSRRFK